ncbi:NAD-dependent succinate-semialdehyde dehydrogenase [Kaustia mangrovi]
MEVPMLAEMAARSELWRLKDPRLLREQAYIGGRWTADASGHVREVTNPANGEVLGAVAALDAEAARKAVDEAADAFEGWRSLLPQERSRILRAWHDAMMDHREDLAVLMTLEQGKPLEESRGEIDYAASFIGWYAEETRRPNVETVTSHLPGAEMAVRREPVGVVALVTPWNFPAAMITRKAAAALAAGCTTVVHPSMETPLSALALAELAERAGVPAGVFNVVTGPAPEIVGVFCEDPRVRALSFTGSTEIGRLLYEQSAATVKRLVLELGGHAPFIVFDDADLEAAVSGAIAAKFVTGGQDCLAANRILVQRGLYDRFVAAFAERASALRVGDGLTDGVEIGPLMNERAVAKCREHVDDALARGARLAAGGEAHALGGLFFAPTVLADVPPDAQIMSEETFGPVAAIAPFDTEEEAVRIANSTEYGLAAYLYTGDYRRVSRVAGALEFGMVAVNRIKITGAPVPFGGVKQSGLGREGSRHGMEEFTELKYLCIDTAS